MELRQQNGGRVHAVTAFSTFAALRLWRAYKVCIPNHAVQYPRAYLPIPSYEQMYGFKGFASSSRCTIVFALHPQVLNKVPQHDPILKKAVEEELHNLSFPVFQAMYFAYMAEQRPDIQEIYRAISKPSFEAVMPGEVCTNCECEKPPPSRHRRSSLVNLRSRHPASEQSKAGSQMSRSTQETDSVTMSTEAFLTFLQNSQGCMRPH